MVAGFVVLLACEASALRYIQAPAVSPPVQVARSVPARALSLALSAEVSAATGESQAAEEQWRLALLHDPTSPYLWLHIAEERRDPNGKLAALQEGLRRGPEVPELWAALAMANPDRQTALEQARRSIQYGETPEGREALCGLTGGQDCVEAWSKLSLRTPGQAQRRGLARLEVGDFAGALEDLTIALVARGPEQWSLFRNVSDQATVPEKVALNNRVRDGWLTAARSAGRVTEAQKTLAYLESRWPEAPMWTEIRGQLTTP